jgi:3-methylcrotonyl-CoA carboxylase beta subunit
MTDQRAENRLFWENEEKKLDERVQLAVWPGGQKAVDKLRKQGKRPVRELI